ncbi:uncharacterized protein LOC102805411 [Saccoglossus kowalevskii]|uniref:Uncharacterized protein LOC102805411 n=1 Tax=Saccoglossus kowalevskii TaxID=10224 RepID=A0ABM0MZ10_SACKO|nr:PREDICTED: uncharacterized protein LOC102805411 [Saccoglossus kowalevskii]
MMFACHIVKTAQLNMMFACDIVKTAHLNMMFTCDVVKTAQLNMMFACDIVKTAHLNMMFACHIVKTAQLNMMFACDILKTAHLNMMFTCDVVKTAHLNMMFACDIVKTAHLNMMFACHIVKTAQLNMMFACDILKTAHLNMMFTCDVVKTTHLNMMLTCDIVITAHLNMMLTCDIVKTAHLNIMFTCDIVKTAYLNMMCACDIVKTAYLNMMFACDIVKTAYLNMMFACDIVKTAYLNMMFTCDIVKTAQLNMMFACDIVKTAHLNMMFACDIVKTAHLNMMFTCDIVKTAHLNMMFACHIVKTAQLNMMFACDIVKTAHLNMMFACYIVKTAYLNMMFACDIVKTAYLNMMFTCDIVKTAHLNMMFACHIVKTAQLNMMFACDIVKTAYLNMMFTCDIVKTAQLNMMFACDIVKTAHLNMTFACDMDLPATSNIADRSVDTREDVYKQQQTYIEKDLATFFGEGAKQEDVLKVNTGASEDNILKELNAFDIPLDVKQKMAKERKELQERMIARRRQEYQQKREEVEKHLLLAQQKQQAQQLRMKQSRPRDVRIAERKQLQQMNKLLSHERNKEPIKTSHYQQNDPASSIRVPYKTDRYLFPIHFYAGGPNYQYNDFRIALSYAIHQKRSIVAVSFAVHFTQDEEGGATKSFSETFDETEMKKIMPLASIEEFKEACGSNLDFIVMNPFDKSNRVTDKYKDEYIRTVETFREIYGITLPEPSIIPQTPQDSLRIYEQSMEQRCIGIFRPWDIDNRYIVPMRQEIYRIIDEHFFWAPYIRNIGERVANSLCDGKPYMALHWRNRTGEPCRLKEKRSGIGKTFIGYASETKCLQRARELQLVNEVARRLPRDISAIMKDYGFPCIYIAYPPYSETIIDVFNKAKVPGIRTIHDMINSGDPDVQRYKDDQYVMSLLEQEICIRAKVFIQRRESNWSEIVKYARDIQGGITMVQQFLPSYTKVRDREGFSFDI